LGGTAKVYFQGVEMMLAMTNLAVITGIDTVARQAVEFDLTNSSGTLTPLREYNESYLDNISEDMNKPTGSDYATILRWWVQQYDYELVAGNYHMVVRVNHPRLETIYTSIPYYIGHEPVHELTSVVHR